MCPVIDFHAHILPDPLKPYLTQWVAEERIQRLRNGARIWINPLRGMLHKIQPALRMLPDGIRKGTDPLSIMASLPGLLVESTPEDLRNVMSRAGVDRAVVVPFPSTADNDYVLQACEEDPQLIPAAIIRHGAPEAGSELRSLAERGAKILKIHPALDGGNPESPTYLELLKVADELKMPVILHTGTLHSRVVFKSPEMAHAELYAPWFERFASITFVLTQMNFHDPETAMDLAETYGNIMLGTAWQPAEIIGEAVRRIGADRVVFASDWPIVGHNMEVGIARIHDCVTTGTLSEEESELVLGGNAERLLRLPPCP